MLELPAPVPTPAPPRASRGAPVALVVLAAGVLAAVAGAHDLGTTETQITLGDSSFEIVMLCDLDALALGAGPGAEDAVNAATLAALSPGELAATTADLADMFARRVRLFADDEWLPFTVEFPDRAAGRTLTMEPPTFLGLTARLRGTLPADAETFRFRLSRAFPDAEIVVIDAEGRTVLQEIVPRGEDSTEFRRRPAPAARVEPTPSLLVWALAGLALLLAGLLGLRRLAARRRQ